MVEKCHRGELGNGLIDSSKYLSGMDRGVENKFEEKNLRSHEMKRSQKTKINLPDEGFSSEGEER